MGPSDMITGRLWVCGSLHSFLLILAIFMGAVYAFLLVVMLVGPERMDHDLIMRDRQEVERYEEKVRAVETEQAETGPALHEIK